MEHLDKNGKKLLVGMEVNVPEPINDDIHLCEFTGVIADLLSDGTAIVEDSDIDFFQIESYRLEIK